MNPAPGSDAAAVEPIRSVAALLAVLDASRALDDEEDVDLLAHGLQCGAILLRERAGDPELQVAGLVHDIGTALVPDDPEHHARHGADAVRDLLGARVARLVAGHAEAKRYLVATDPRYRAALSGRSIETLSAQGGPLDERGVAAFRRGRDADALVALRLADDGAKDPEARVPGLEAWKSRLVAVARA